MPDIKTYEKFLHETAFELPGVTHMVASGGDVRFAGQPPFRAQVHLAEEARRIASLTGGRTGVVFQPADGRRSG